MRPFRLARVAAEAEGVRLRRMATRIVTRVVFAVIALFFVLGAVVFAHIAAWYEARIGLNQSALATAGILGGTDLVLAIILGLFAARSTPSRVEVEALDVRRKAIEAIGSVVSWTQLVIAILQIAANLQRRMRD